MPVIFGTPRALEVVKADKDFFHFTRLGEDPNEMIDCPACKGRGILLTLSGWAIDDNYCHYCDGDAQVTRRRANDIYRRHVIV